MDKRATSKSKCISNSGCAAHSHIEGIVTEDRELRVLEMIHDFPAYQNGDCFEYVLKQKPGSDKLEFEGEIFSRIHHNDYRKTKIGEAEIYLNTSWQKGSCDESHVASLNLIDMPTVRGRAEDPLFWEKFLTQIEDAGFNHLYEAQTSELREERAEAKRIAQEHEQDRYGPPNGIGTKDDLPF